VAYGKTNYMIVDFFSKLMRLNSLYTLDITIRTGFSPAFDRWFCAYLVDKIDASQINLIVTK
jgi:hypothetical protein